MKTLTKPKIELKEVWAQPRDGCAECLAKTLRAQGETVLEIDPKRGVRIR